MTEQTAKASQYIIDLARSAKSFIAAAGEESLPDESLMRAAVTFNMLQRRGMIAAVVRNDDTMCKPHDFDDMYRAHAIALIAHNFTDNLTGGCADRLRHWRQDMSIQDDDMTRRLRHAADTLDEDEDNAPMFAALMRRAALRIEHMARDEQARTVRADAEQARLEIALRDTDAAAKAMAAAKTALATHKAAPVQVETQPECPVHPRDRPVVPEALDAATRAERDRVLALARQMCRDCQGLHSTLARRLEALIEDISCGARTYP